MALLSVVALGLGLRLWALDRARPLGLVGDESYYARTARNLAAGRGHLYVETPSGTPLWSWRPPAHSFLLSLAVADPMARMRESLPAMALQQVLWGTLLVAAVAGLGASLFDARTGLLAAAGVAVYPTFVAHSHYLWSETFFTLVIVLALTGVVRAQRRPGPGLAVATGVAFGVATLTREVAVPVAVVCAAWWIGCAPAGRRAPALRRAVLMLGVLALVVAPWSLRNYRVQGRLIPVGSVGWFGAAEGNTLERPEWWRPRGPRASAYSRAYFALGAEVERLDFARAEALAQIRAEQPAWIFKKLVRNGALLLSPDSYLLFKLRRGAYGELHPTRYRVLAALCAGSYTLVLVGGALGLVLARGRRGLALGVLGSVALLHVVLVAAVRFRLPWMPLLMIYASHALLHRRELPSALAGRGWIAPAVGLAFYAGLSVPFHLLYGGPR